MRAGLTQAAVGSARPFPRPDYARFPGATGAGPQVWSTGRSVGTAAASGPPYRRVMSFSLSLARTDYDTAVTQFPAVVPVSWVGVDSAACQTALDHASGLLAALATRYDAALCDVSIVEARSSSSGMSPS